MVLRYLPFFYLLSVPEIPASLHPSFHPLSSFSLFLFCLDVNKLVMLHSYQKLRSILNKHGYQFQDGHVFELNESDAEEEENSDAQNPTEGQTPGSSSSKKRKIEDDAVEPVVEKNQNIEEAVNEDGPKDEA